MSGTAHSEREGKAQLELTDPGKLTQHRQVELEDDETAKQRSAIDDEYALSGVRDPKVCVTTSRDPSTRLKQFAKEMKLVVPNAQRINRGNHKVRQHYSTWKYSTTTALQYNSSTRTALHWLNPLLFVHPNQKDPVFMFFHATIYIYNTRGHCY